LIYELNVVTLAEIEKKNIEKIVIAVILMEKTEYVVLNVKLYQNLQLVEIIKLMLMKHATIVLKI